MVYVPPIRHFTGLAQLVKICLLTFDSKMFVTFAGLEGHVPSQALSAGFQYWDAAVLQTPVPWYLVSIVRRGKSERHETLFVASEPMLVDVLNELGDGSVIGLVRFDATLGSPAPWQMTELAEVWCDARRPEGARLSFRLPGETLLRDASLAVTKDEQRGWLLARVSDVEALQV